jgi:hypothetical protein
LAAHDDLGAIMVWREQRTVTAALTLHYNKTMFILEPNEISSALARKRVTVCEFPDGKVEVQYEGHVLPYRVFDKIRQVNQAAIVDNKQLGAALAMAQQLQAMMPPRKRNNDEPSRRSQPVHMFPSSPSLGPESSAVDRAAAARPGPRKRGRPPLSRQSSLTASA